jgi:hypothetical protein
MVIQNIELEDKTQNQKLEGRFSFHSNLPQLSR